MKVNGTHYRSVWAIGEDAFGIIDQTRLPHEFVTLTLRSADDAAHAIKSMQTRGAPLIGAVGASGLALAVREDASDEAINPRPGHAGRDRPTCHQSQMGAVADARRPAQPAAWQARGAGLGRSQKIADEDVAMSEAIGFNGLKLIQAGDCREEARPRPSTS